MFKRSIFAAILISVFLFQGIVSAAGHTTRHTVQHGETLSEIAHHYDVELEFLARHNGVINPHLIFVGQVLIIPEPVIAYPPPPNPPVGIHDHVVKYGQSLSWIANFYKSDLHEIIDLNHITHPNLIHPGQVIRIPVNW